MAIQRIASQDATGTSSTTSVSATYAATPTINNLLIAIVGDNDGDNQSTTITGWTRAAGSAGGSASAIAIFYKISTGADSTTVTANNANASLMIISVFEYSGLSSSFTLDKKATDASQLSATCLTGTTPTTILPDELLIAAAYGTGAAVTLTSWSNSFDTRTDVPNATVTRLASADRIVSTVGAYTSTVTFSGAFGSIAAGIATFKSAGAGNITLLGVG